MAESFLRSDIDSDGGSPAGFEADRANPPRGKERVRRGAARSGKTRRSEVESKDEPSASPRAKRNRERQRARRNGTEEAAPQKAKPVKAKRRTAANGGAGAGNGAGRGKGAKNHAAPGTKKATPKPRKAVKGRKKARKANKSNKTKAASTSGQSVSYTKPAWLRRLGEAEGYKEELYSNLPVPLIDARDYWGAYVPMYFKKTSVDELMRVRGAVQSGRKLPAAKEPDIPTPVMPWQAADTDSKQGGADGGMRDGSSRVKLSQEARQRMREAAERAAGANARGEAEGGAGGGASAAAGDSGSEEAGEVDAMSRRAAALKQVPLDYHLEGLQAALEIQQSEVGSAFDELARSVPTRLENELLARRQALEREVDAFVYYHVTRRDVDRQIAEDRIVEAQLREKVQAEAGVEAQRLQAEYDEKLAKRMKLAGVMFVPVEEEPQRNCDAAANGAPGGVGAQEGSGAGAGAGAPPPPPGAHV